MTSRLVQSMHIFLLLLYLTWYLCLKHLASSRHMTAPLTLDGPRIQGLDVSGQPSTSLGGIVNDFAHMMPIGAGQPVFSIGLPTDQSRVGMPSVDLLQLRVSRGQTQRVIRGKPILLVEILEDMGVSHRAVLLEGDFSAKHLSRHVAAVAHSPRYTRVEALVCPRPFRLEIVQRQVGLQIYQLYCTLTKSIERQGMAYELIVDLVVLGPRRDGSPDLCVSRWRARQGLHGSCGCFGYGGADVAGSCAECAPR